MRSALQVNHTPRVLKGNQLQLYCELQLIATKLTLYICMFVCMALIFFKKISSTLASNQHFFGAKKEYKL